MCVQQHRAPLCHHHRPTPAPAVSESRALTAAQGGFWSWAGVHMPAAAPTTGLGLIGVSGMKQQTGCSRSEAIYCDFIPYRLATSWNNPGQTEDQTSPSK